MSRRHALRAYLFGSILVLLFAATVNAQSSLPTKLAVSSAQRSVGVREQTELRIRLLDQTGNEIAAPYNMRVTLIATRQKDIDTAKRDGRGNIGVQDNGKLALPAGVNTVQTGLTIYKGHRVATLQFSSHQAGLIRIYAENERLVTGALFIAVVDRSGKASRTDGRDSGSSSVDGGSGKIFRLASFQETHTRPATPHPPATAAGTVPAYELKIERLNNAVVNDKGEHVDTISVLLMSGGTHPRAPHKLTVRLSVVPSGGAKLSQSEITIPKDNYIYPKDIEVTVPPGSKIEVEATPVDPKNMTVQPAQPAVFDFSKKIRATKLQVHAGQTKAMANGVQSIKLIVRPVDDGNNPVNKHEGLEVRNIKLSLDSLTPGPRFENEATTLQIKPIKKDDEFVETSIISSRSVVGAKIIATSENADGLSIEGRKELEFYFPWASLGCAMFGGLMSPLLLRYFPGKQREQRFVGDKSEKVQQVLKYGLGGLFLGMMAFALIFFDVLGAAEFNFNGIPITLSQFPIDNGLAALAIGFFGTVMLATGISIKEHLQSRPGGAESTVKA